MSLPWHPIQTPRIPQPTTGTYSDWKELLAEEGKHRCVYCAIPEAAWGGHRNFHVEHYRPKKPFVELTNKIENLFYACSVCNGFKLNDWPGDPTPALDTNSYPDPSSVDYNTIMTEDERWYLTGANVAAQYTVNQLYLNRPQLLLERRNEALARRLTNALTEIETLKELAVNAALDIQSELTRLSEALIRVLRVNDAIRQVRPYEGQDLSRPRGGRSDAAE